MTNKIYKFRKNFSFFLIMFFPSSLVIGPLIAELTMNIFSIIFLYKIINSKKKKIFKNYFFIIFFIFFLYILLNSFLSLYYDKIIFKNLFYFRFGLFSIAVYYFLIENKNANLIFFKILVLTLLIVTLDGYFQYFFNSNILGFNQIREDRLSGFFNDQQIIGSYLIRLFPLMIGLFFFNLNHFNVKQKILYISIFITIFFLILLSGERAASIFAIFFCINCLIFVSYNKIIKIFSIIFLCSSLFLIFFFSQNLYQRHIVQTFQQVNLKFTHQNFFSNFSYYEDIYETAYNGFKNKKIIGQGANSFRYFCSNEDLAVTTKKVEKLEIRDLVENYEMYNFDAFKNKYLEKKKYKKNEILFKYKNKITNHIIYYILKEDLELVSAKASNVEHLYVYKYVNGCTTHPHNFYLQALSELGILGFLFLLIIWLYLIYSTIILFFNKKFDTNHYNLRICLAIGFIAFLLPFIPSGNLFNNWINMITYFPLGFYLFSILKMNKKENNDT